ncbi:MAG: hypothetical protein ACYTF0_09020, partial [Planctomycetota bacterium]
PGLAATWRDGNQHLLATATATSLLDSTGTPTASLAAGTIVRRVDRTPWADRVLVATADDQRGWLPLLDTRP